MALALALIRWNEVSHSATLNRCDMPGYGPAFLGFLPINGPLVLPYSLWSVLLSYQLSFGLFVVAVGALWYWVVLNAYAWCERREVLMFSRPPARFATDAGLVLTGTVYACAAALARYKAACSTPCHRSSRHVRFWAGPVSTSSSADVISSTALAVVANTWRYRMKVNACGRYASPP